LVSELIELASREYLLRTAGWSKKLRIDWTHSAGNTVRRLIISESQADSTAHAVVRMSDG